MTQPCSRLKLRVWPLMFNIFINDIKVGITSNIIIYLEMIPSYASKPRCISDDMNSLKRNLDRIGEWTETWQNCFNSEKCKARTLGAKNTEGNYTMSGFC